MTKPGLAFGLLLLVGAAPSYAQSPCYTTAECVTVPVLTLVGVSVSDQTQPDTLYLSGNRFYVGDVRDGKPNGVGSMAYPDGQHYFGDFRDGLRHGHAIVGFADGRTFVGEYRDDKRNGHGYLVMATSDRFEGEYRDGEKNGQGTSYVNGKVEYSGLWTNGQANGMPVKATLVAQPPPKISAIVQAPAGQTPEAFLDSLYATFRHGGKDVPDNQTFVPSLLLMMAHSGAIADGPGFDASYLCGCQESNTDHPNLHTSVRRTGSDRAVGTAGLELGDAKHPEYATMTLQLVLLNGQWRVEDISYVRTNQEMDNLTLRGYYTNDLAHAVDWRTFVPSAFTN